MRKILFAGWTALACLISTQAFAQWNINWQGSGNWGPESTFVKLFDIRTVNQFHGTVDRVDRAAPAKGMCYGVTLKLKTEHSTLNVQLGPAWFVENQDFKIAPGDTIEVIGSRVSYDHKPLIIATEVIKGDTALKLRDPNGSPVWCAWKTKAADTSEVSSDQMP
jgi:hypothetical protein